MAGQQQRFDRVFPVPPEDLFAAFREAVEQGRYKVVRVDDFARSIEFKTVHSLRAMNTPPVAVQGQVTSDGHGSRIELVTAMRSLALSGTTGTAKLMGALLADISDRAAKAAA